ncbi:hypothetical protein BT69DRAFT_1346563 [Atractiella rhizophila]|nr:hypothetical protein BT69DRAFT_1346563 [Atractiella rhizophila]
MRLSPRILNATKSANYVFPHATSYVSKPAGWAIPKDSKGFINTLANDNPIVRWYEKQLRSSGGVAFEGTEKEKLRKSGEDAFFMTSMKDGTGLAMGVQDGVGGYSDSGIDAKDYSIALAYYCSRLFASFRLYPPSNSIHEDTASPSSSSAALLEENPPPAFAGSWLPPLPSGSATSRGSAGGANGNGFRSYSTWSQDEGGETERSVAVLDEEEGERFVLQQAVTEMGKDDSILAGGSTSCLVTLNSKTAALRSLNLGDSGFLVLRSSRVIYSSPPLTTGFNAPLQLYKGPSYGQRMRALQSSRRSLLNQGQLRNFLRLTGSSPKLDRWVLSRAESNKLQLKAGDVVIVSTDGYSDNVWEKETEMIVELVMKERGELDDDTLMKKLANSCVSFASQCAWNRTKYTPFEHEARQYGELEVQGGKVDDITVQCALVVEK